MHSVLISLVHRLWIALPQVTALRRCDISRICHFFPTLDTGLPRFCTSCPQARAHRKPGPEIADIFLPAKTLALAQNL